MRFFLACEYCEEAEWCLDSEGQKMNGCSGFKWATCKTCIWHDDEWGMCRYTNESIHKDGDARCCRDYTRVTEEEPQELMFSCDDTSL